MHAMADAVSSTVEAVAASLVVEVAALSTYVEASTALFLDHVVLEVQGRAAMKGTGRTTIVNLPPPFRPVRTS